MSDTSFNPSATNPSSDPSMAQPNRAKTFDEIVAELQNEIKTATPAVNAQRQQAQHQNEDSVKTSQPSSQSTTANASLAKPPGKKNGLQMALGALALVVLAGGALVTSRLNQTSQDLRQQAAGPACISCGGGTCPDGWSYGPDSCAPQATCQQRADEACRGHQVTGGGGGGTCNGGISCANGNCQDGAEYGADSCAPQKTCYDRAVEFCGKPGQAPHGGPRDGGGAGPTPTPGTGGGAGTCVPGQIYCKATTQGICSSVSSQTPSRNALIGGICPRSGLLKDIQGLQTPGTDGSTGGYCEFYDACAGAGGGTGAVQNGASCAGLTRLSCGESSKGGFVGCSGQQNCFCGSNQGDGNLTCRGTAVGGQYTAADGNVRCFDDLDKNSCGKGPGTTTYSCNSSCTTDAQCKTANGSFVCSNGKCRLGSNTGSESCTPPATSKPTPSPTPSPTPAPVCAVGFTVAPPTPKLSCVKTSYKDEASNSAGNYNLITKKTSFKPGDVVVFKIDITNTGATNAVVTLTDPLTGANLDQFDFLDSNCGANAYDATTRTLTCPAINSEVRPAEVNVYRVFRVRIKDTAPADAVLTNTANLKSGTFETSCSVPITLSPNPTPTPTPTPTPSPTPSPTYSCNSSCTSDSQCQSVNAGYICDSASGNRCRLDSNRTSETCTPKTQTYACNSSCSTNEQCQTASSSYICYNGNCRLDRNVTAYNCLPAVVPSPSPVVGCNYTCQTNADCASPNHICMDTAQGKRCRLENYPNSESCTPPVVVYTPPVKQQPVPVQPVPVSGAKDTFKYIMAGAGAVILGALGLLLL